MFSNFFPKTGGKYGKAEHAIDDYIMRRMRFACWITKVRYKHTNTYSEYVMLFPR